MEHCHLPYKNSSISYYQFGNGPRPVLCFHGYGEKAGSFSFFESYAGDQFTFYSIDLPFHGNTTWNEGLNFTTSDLQQIITAILQTGDHYPSPEKNKLTLIGFSLGGRVALSLYQAQPSTIERMVLLAPDGLKVNFWYWLATQSRTGNKFFAYTMKRPSWYFGLLKGLNKLGVVNASIFKFVNYYIHDKEVRQQLYNRWTCLRKLKPDLSQIKSAVKENGTAVRVVYGQHDRIILSSVGERFRKGMEENCQISVIHAGHQVLHEKHVKELLPALLH